MRNFQIRTFLPSACLFFMLLVPTYPYAVNIDNIVYLTAGQPANKDSFRNFHNAVLRAKHSVEQAFDRDFKMPLKIVITRDAPQFTRLTGFNWKTGGVYDKRRKQLVLQNLNSLFKQGIVSSLLKHELCHAMYGQLESKDVVMEEALCLAFAGLNYELYPQKKLKPSIELFKKEMVMKLYGKGKDRQNAYALLSLWGAELLSRKPMRYWASNQDKKLEGISYRNLRKKLNQVY